MSDEDNGSLPTAVEPIARVRKEIYIGPSIPSRGLQKFVVFEEIPDHLVVDEILSRLFVPVEDLSKARVALRREGSPEWTAYRAAVAAFLSKKVR
jgi:hypothetical protein